MRSTVQHEREAAVDASSVNEVSEDECSEAKDKSAAIGTSNAMIQRMYAGPAQSSSEAVPEETQAAAQAGVEGPGQELPHAGQIQAAFGHHDIGGVRAHIGGEGGAAADAMGAEAYATGNNVAFSEQPDLHTAAHEAAHTVQQKGGVQLKGGVGQVDDAYEQNADHVADLVVRGDSAESALDAFAQPDQTVGSSTPVQMKRKRKGDLDVVGGNASKAQDLETKGGKKLEAGDKGYSFFLSKATAKRADNFDYDSWRVQHEAPDYTELEKSQGYWAKRKVKMEEEENGWGHVPSSRATWAKRRVEAEGAVMTLETHRAQSDQKFTKFNSWVPMANGFVTQMTRNDAQMAMLGIDIKDMGGKMSEGMDDATAVGQRAITAKGSVSIPAPRSDTSVASVGVDTIQSFNEMDTAYLAFQRVLQQNRAKKIDAEGDDTREELASYQQVRQFLSKAGGVIDMSMARMKSAPAAVANFSGKLTHAQAALNAKRNQKAIMNGKRPGHNPTYLTVNKDGALVVRNMQTGDDKFADPELHKEHGRSKSPDFEIGLPTSVQDVLTGVFDFAFHSDLLRLNQVLEAIKVRVGAAKGVGQLVFLKSLAQNFQDKLNRFAQQAFRLQQTMAQRRDEYRQFGEQLDQFARGNAESRKAGQAPKNGQERYALLMTVLSEIRLTVALGGMAKASIGAPDSWLSWIQSMQTDRPSPGLGKGKELDSLAGVYGQIKGYHGAVGTVEKILGPIDASAAEMIKALSAGGGSGQI